MVLAKPKRQMTRDRFLDRFEHFTGEKQQVEAVTQLWAALDLGFPSVLDEEATWAKTFSSKPPAKNPLVRPYCSQLDNGPNGWRQCQTSSIAMELIGTKTPKILDDLDYLRIVQKYGDTTLQQSHIKALTELKVPHKFSNTWGSPDVIKKAIDSGKGFIAGLLHHGPVTAPSGGGHYVLIYGYTATAWMVHDPYGELDLVNGGWANRAIGSGKAVTYSFKNFNARWDCKAPGQTRKEQWGWILR
jgi:hypothetical protein